MGFQRSAVRDACTAWRERRDDAALLARLRRFHEEDGFPVTNIATAAASVAAPWDSGEREALARLLDQALHGAGGIVRWWAA